MGREGIICAGNWIVDRVKTIDAFPTEETLANIISESQQNGGAAFNVLVDLAKLGAKFPLAGVGCIGDDADGQFIRTTCEQFGIDHSRLLCVDHRTSFTDVMSVSRTGKRTFFHHRGANSMLGADQFDFTCLNGQHLHLGYLLLLDQLDAPDVELGTGAARVLASAKGHGLTTSVDLVSSLQPSEAIVIPALRYVDVCFMNELELGALLGQTIADDEPIDSLWQKSEKLFANLSGTLVLHSAKWAHVISSNGIEHSIPSAHLRSDKIRGTVGAGDAFAAGYLMGFLQGRSTSVCLEWGAAAGASCLLGEGASNGVLPLEQALDLLKMG